MTAIRLPLLAALLGRTRRTCAVPAAPDLGYGYSRDTDNGTPDAPVPDGVELIFLTGRTPRGAR